MGRCAIRGIGEKFAADRIVALGPRRCRMQQAPRDPFVVRSFRSLSLNRDTCNPNPGCVDLDGDGHADVLITEDDAFVWHVS